MYSGTLEFDAVLPLHIYVRIINLNKNKTESAETFNYVGNALYLMVFIFSDGDDCLQCRPPDKDDV